ncbi:hypothetical protein [Endozoicomonas sp. 8E]|uniref:hypothetical protein n=1 Tax=Endozoicomonas sp. 8E TaxID=3035692 RepID=UPI002938EE8B|nr:hypothetical protein [Endozoicomonas sp. 8E]WOG27079.1 hypothetical protein P6910_21390 [Endozoicomonas sp. 8E]
MTKLECRDRAIKHSSFSAPLLLLLSLSFICQAEPLTGRFIVEFEQDAGPQNRSFSVKRVPHALSDNPSDNADKSVYTGSVPSPDDNQHRPGSYGVDTTIIESISWQLFYANHLLPGYELILTNRSAPPRSTPYSWIPVEVVIAVSWLLKSYWRPHSTLFNPMELKEAQQKASQNHPFAIITALFGSEHNQQQHPPSEPPGQQAPQATTQPAGSIISPRHSASGRGNRSPQQFSHTLGLNCFVYPCHGVCGFRTSSNSTEPSKWPTNSEDGSSDHAAVKPGQKTPPHSVSGYSPDYSDHSDFENAKDFQQIRPFGIWINPPDIHLQCASGQPSEHETDQHQPHGIDGNLNGCNPTRSMSTEVANTDPIKTVNDDIPMRRLPVTADDLVIVNGLLKLRGQNLLGKTGISGTSTHSETQQTTSESTQSGQSQPDLFQTGAIQATNNSGQKVCHETMTVKNDQLRSCGKACKNNRALVDHKYRDHTGQQVCEVIEPGQDGQQQLCGMTCKNAKALLSHKSRGHSGQKTCDRTVIGNDDQPRPCGKLYKNAHALSTHKSRFHTGQKVCDVTVVGEDGQLRPCGIIFKNAPSMSSHKSRVHSGQKTCDAVVVGEDTQLRPCGKFFKNAQDLSFHKRRDHTGQQVCDETMVVMDGQQRRCGKICLNAHALSVHKRLHRKRKPVHMNQED